MKKKNLIFGGIWIAIMSAVIASTLTLLLTDGALFSSHWVSDEEYATIARYSRLEEIRQTLTEDYYREVDDETLMNGAAKGMMNSLEDPYTCYFTPEEAAANEMSESGNYCGIGATVFFNEEGLLQIAEVYEGAPAQTAGLRAGDCILRIDDTDLAGGDFTLNDAVSLILGEEGTTVCLEIRRGEETSLCEVLRGMVNISYVAQEMLTEDIGCITIEQFTGDDVTAFNQALEALQSAGAKGLIIDLRGNPGGLLDDVVAICDRILPEGLIVATEDRNGEREEHYSDAEYWDVPLVVLIDGNSASASEILASSVKDFGRGTIIGENSFGKGIAQTGITFAEDGAGMQYTFAQYYTLSGESIHGVGIAPDIEISDDPDTEADECIERALEVLRAQIQ